VSLSLSSSSSQDVFVYFVCFLFVSLHGIFFFIAITTQRKATEFVRRCGNNSP